MDIKNPIQISEFKESKMFPCVPVLTEAGDPGVGVLLYTLSKRSQVKSDEVNFLNHRLVANLKDMKCYIKKISRRRVK